MGKGSSLDLENLIRHLPGRDTSYISWCTSEGLDKLLMSAGCVTLVVREGQAEALFSSGRAAVTCTRWKCDRQRSKNVF